MSDYTAIEEVTQPVFATWFDGVRTEDGLGMGDPIEGAEKRVHTCLGQKTMELHAAEGGEAYWFLLSEEVNGVETVLAGAAARVNTRRSKREATLETMYVIKSARGQGNATRLAAHVLEYNPTTIGLGVGLRANTLMATTFERLGFARNAQLEDWAPIQAGDLAAAVEAGLPAPWMDAVADGL